MPWHPDDEPIESWDDDAPDDEEAGDDGDETETVPCPACRRPVAELADRCPHCGEYIIPGRAPPRHKGWLVIVVLIAIGIVLLWSLRG